MAISYHRKKKAIEGGGGDWRGAVRHGAIAGIGKQTGAAACGDIIGMAAGNQAL
jgi:hypothetical protein